MGIEQIIKNLYGLAFHESQLERVIKESFHQYNFNGITDITILCDDGDIIAYITHEDAPVLRMVTSRINDIIAIEGVYICKF